MRRDILVVDDDDRVRDLTRTILERAGCQVVTANSIESAQRVIAERVDWREFCVIVDVVLSEENGLRFARELILRHPGIRVLLISGFSNAVVMIEPEAMGRAAFLAKPFTGNALVAAVDELYS